MFLSFSGGGISFLTGGYRPEGTLGTNTRKQIADTLNTTGMRPSILLSGLPIFTVLRILKKRTKILEVKER